MSAAGETGEDPWPVTRPRVLQMRLLGAGAMRSPRYAPAGLLLRCGGHRVMFDGGPGATPDADSPLDVWLVTDLHSELIAQIRRIARRYSLEPEVAPFGFDDVRIEPHPVEHTSHPSFAYLIHAGQRSVAWAPEFRRLPTWAAGVDLLFADAAGWRQPIRFAGGVGGHAAALDTAAEAKRMGVRRLVFAHIGRPTIKALEAGEILPFGELGRDKAVYRLPFAGPHGRNDPGGP